MRERLAYDKSREVGAGQVKQIVICGRVHPIVGDYYNHRSDVPENSGEKNEGVNYGHGDETGQRKGTRPEIDFQIFVHIKFRVVPPHAKIRSRIYGHYNGLHFANPTNTLFR